MTRPVVLFRGSLTEEEELIACKKYFPVITQRSLVRSNDLVISRYSALPWYKEFETDVFARGGVLINDYRDHLYVADLENWYDDLREFTPKTWFHLDQIPEKGPFVLKGATYSKKHNWNDHMFARDKREAGEVACRLACDGLIGSQPIYVREYVPLRKLADGLQGMPVGEEYRFFVLNGKILAGGFYWSEHTDYIKDQGFNPDPEEVPSSFLEEVISIVAPNIDFFVVDVARTAEGKWIVIELNDGQMSGLSDIDPDELYRNLKEGCNAPTM